MARLCARPQSAGAGEECAAMPGWGWALLALVAVAILVFAAVKGLR